MSRAAIVGTGVHPLILRLFLEAFKVWSDEVDVLYVAIDHYSEPSTRDYIVNLVKQFPKAILMEECRGWPDSYQDAYLASKEDTFLILHDDTLIYKKGIVDKYFKIAEEGKVATPFQGIYEPSEFVNEAINKKYGWENPPYSFLLYFLFISRENLKKTSINFNGIGWKKGDDIPLLGIKDSPVSVAGDTGWILALELFENELFDKQIEFHRIPRSETAGLARLSETVDLIPLLIQWMRDKKNIFGEGWLHLQNTGNTIPLWFKEDLDTREWNKDVELIRLAWMYEMMQTDTFDEIPEFKEKAQQIFDGVVLRCGADIDKIKTIANIFHILLYG